PQAPNTSYIPAASNADAGIVITHAQITRLATPQRTYFGPRVVPTPMMAPVIVCVVDTGMPAAFAPKRQIAPPVSAQKPWTGCRSAIFWPIVFTIRQPPDIVPRPIAVWHASAIQSGACDASATGLPTTATIAMITPIVF